jgi:hypothetical protein
MQSAGAWERVFVPGVVGNAEMLDGGDESHELNQFLSTHRILTVERHFVADGSM